MNKKRIYLLALVLLALISTATIAYAANPLRSRLAAIRAATAKYKDLGKAQADGYEPFLDCFDNPGVGGMGYHYVNFGILDLNLDMLEPEAMVYPVGPDGQLSLGAVEYIVPAADWDAAGNSEPPKLLGQTFHLNSDLGVYVLHAWVFERNPAGIFEDWNPNVTCN